jgi:hypothetical protein
MSARSMDGQACGSAHTHRRGSLPHQPTRIDEVCTEAACHISPHASTRQPATHTPTLHTFVLAVSLRNRSVQESLRIWTQAMGECGCTQDSTPPRDVNATRALTGTRSHSSTRPHS